MSLTGLIGQRDLPLRDMFDRYELHIYKQWLRDLMQSKMIVVIPRGPAAAGECPSSCAGRPLLAWPFHPANRNVTRWTRTSLAPSSTSAGVGGASCAALPRRGAPRWKRLQIAFFVAASDHEDDLDKIATYQGPTRPRAFVQPPGRQFVPCSLAGWWPGRAAAGSPSTCCCRRRRLLGLSAHPVAEAAANAARPVPDRVRE